MPSWCSPLRAVRVLVLYVARIVCTRALHCALCVHSCSPQLIRFSGVALGEACTIVLRGATKQILDEAERSLHDALCVLTQTVKETRTVFGGGAFSIDSPSPLSCFAACVVTSCVHPTRADGRLL